jgi:branched-chain amino acid transport system ATP-binding protein
VTQAAATSPILQLERASKSYGALRATDELSINLAPGEALGVLGPNGAGKSTMFNLITGGVRLDAGRIRFEGRDITALPAYARCRAGIGRSHQIPHPFAQMTVFENLLVGATFGGAHMRRATRRQQEDFCVDVLRRTELIAMANRLAGSLTLLERKRLELARALATRPRLLLLDEIAGGLTEHECHVLVETIRAVHASGTAIIWIEHVVHALRAVVDRLVVLNFGRLIAEGDPDAVLASAEFREIYMGIAA